MLGSVSMATKKASAAERREFRDKAFLAALPVLIQRANGGLAPYGVARLAWEIADAALRLRAGGAPQ